MARSFKGTVQVKLDGEYKNDSTGAKDTLSLSANNTLTNGTAANKAQRLWESTGRTLGASASEDIDVYDLGTLDIGAGSGVDSLGQSFALAGVKAIYVYNHSDSGGSLAVGNKNATTALSTPFNGSDTGAVTVAPGGIFLLSNPSAAGFAVADTTDHLLTITDGGSGCTYDIAIIGI